MSHSCRIGCSPSLMGLKQCFNSTCNCQANSHLGVFLPLQVNERLVRVLNLQDPLNMLMCNCHTCPVRCVYCVGQ